MWMRILGSAAGGGFPQWNCTCPPCRAVRSGAPGCTPRSQSSIAVSADRSNWYLLNASPDIQRQIEAFPDLHPDEGRVVRLKSVLLTDAELDHTLGLLLMREGTGLQVHATESVHDTLTHGTGVLRTLEAYCPVKWHPVVPGAELPLGDGLTYCAFDVPTDKVMRFPSTATSHRVVGYRITDTGSGHTLVFLPCVQQLTTEVLDQIDGSDCLLIDGTCFTDNEMEELGLAKKTSRSMGHVPIDGPDGSLALLQTVRVGRTIYTHMNNTNPILLEDSPQRQLLNARGIDVAADGMDLEI